MFADVEIPSNPKYFNPHRDSLHFCNLGFHDPEPDWEQIIASSPRFQEDLACVEHFVACSDHGNFDAQYPFLLVAYERLEALGIPSVEWKGEEAAALGEKEMRATMADFWTTQVNPRQIEKGKPVAEPPKVSFLTWSQIYVCHNKLHPRG